MAVDLNKIRRYELKYTITESVARQIREWISPLFSQDPYADPETRGYTVNNLYMDTPDLQFYYDTKFRKLSRFKQRIRYYGNTPDDIAMLEIKYRHNLVIWKKRYKISMEQWPGVLAVCPEERCKPRQIGPQLSFPEVHHYYGTIPILHVRYFREPYVSDIDEYGRVTFDRALRYRLADGSYEMGADDREMIYYDDPMTTNNDDSPVILELKSETFVPFWLTELVHRFELLQRGFSKYCYVLDRCAENDMPIRQAAL